MHVLHVAVFVLVASTLSFRGVFAIEGGVRVKKGEFQFAVWLERNDSGRVSCGGSLVASEYVLTLASCVEDGNMGDYQVTVGDRHLLKTNDGQTEHSITDVVKFSDVALLKTSPVADTDLKNIDTITLHSEMNLLGNETCFLTSFGYQKPTRPSKIQQKLNIKLKADGKCSDMPMFNRVENLCYWAKRSRGSKKGKACVGDGGSAVVCDVMGAYKLVAINMETSCVSELHTAMAASDLISWVDSVINSPSPSPSLSCLELHRNGERQSGVYTIYPLPSNKPVQVYCDMDTDGGGWTVFQRRQDGSVNFYRTWTEYASGFGNVSGEFWLGNDLISSLTSRAPHELRIDMNDYANNSAFAKYGIFHLWPSAAKYTLEVGGFSGSAGDSLIWQSGMAFSTRDRDHDGWSEVNCAELHSGGWWYNGCAFSNLNGLYGQGQIVLRGVWWVDWKGYDPLMWTEMKLRATTQA